MLDPVEFGKAVAVIVREAQAPLLQRLEEANKRIELLEARQPERGKDGEPGASVTAQDVAPMIAEQVRAAVAAIPAARDGIDGAAGRDADPIDVKEVVAELLTCPEMKTLADLYATEAVEKYFEAHPVQHGKDGRDGKEGERGLPGDMGRKGEPGEDGIGIAGAMIDREGCLIVTTTKGVTVNLGCVVGKDGERGKDGSDCSFVSMDFDGHRTVSIKAGNTGEVVKTYKIGVPMDAGYWREGMQCEKADVVTHAGSAWLALRDTAAKPCLENKDDWRLFARGGRNGADGAPGRNLGPPDPVKLK